MKSLRQYYLFFLASILPIIGLAQSDQIEVKKVPFVNNSDNTIHQILQDSTGLLWFMSSDKMYISDGEKVTPTPTPFESNPNRIVYSMMNFTNQDGNFSLGGDSLRIFNPYTRDIIQSIGLNAKYTTRNTKPTLWMFLKGEAGDVWAVITTNSIDENNRLVKGNSIIHSKNGDPFQKVVNAPFFLYSQSITARGKQLFLSTNDTVLQYTSKGELVKTYTFPPLKSIPYTAKNQVAADGTIRFMHFLKNEKTGEFDRAIYELKPNESEFTVRPFPELNGIEFHRFDEVGDFFWLKGYGMSLHRVSLKDGTVTDYSKIIFQQHPDIFYDDAATFNEIFEDATGTIWASTSNKWLLKIENTARPFFKTSRIEDRFPIQLSQLIYYDSKKDTLVHTSDNLQQLSTLHVYPNHLYFNLDVFVPDFRDAEQNTYTWSLEGYDADWVKPSTNNAIHYDNLPVGKYTLRIRGGVTEDYYESSEKQIQVIVHQAWYKSWWAWSLYLITFFSLVYLVYQNQVSRQLKKLEANRLKEMDMLKSRLYTNITHEFRTPLTVIMGMAGNIKETQERRLILRNSKNLLRLVNQLLDLSKMDAGHLKLNLVNGDIIQYLRYLTESFYSMASDKNIGLTFSTETEELLMSYDEVKVQHIIYNLLTNAIKFTSSGGKIILHTKAVEVEKKSLLQIKVSDTGIGISKEEVLKIFDRFYQIDSSSTRKSGGTGIGLAMTKEYIEMMGGSIAVESKLGIGTDILMLLPMIKIDNNMTNQKYPSNSDTKTKEEKKQEIPKVKELIEDPSIPSLLIIEDNQDVITYIKGLLSDQYHITIAEDGDAGIERAFEIIPDIIISDVMMPKKDGYQVCKELKNDNRTSHIPIILLTAKASNEDRFEGLSTGADAFLTKPFHKEELFIRLEKLLKLRKLLQQRYSGAEFIAVPEGQEKILTLDERLLKKLITAVKNSLGNTDFTVQDLCETAQLSNTHLNRKLKFLTGKTPSQFIRTIKLQEAMILLKTTDLNISEIAYQVGFNNPNYFSRTFSEEFGKSPMDSRK